MGKSFAQAASSRGRSLESHPQAQQDHETHGHDPILGQLVHKYLSGQIELTQPVLVGLHRALGSPGRVREAIASRRAVAPQASAQAMASPEVAPQALAPEALAQHFTYEHLRVAAPHAEHHSMSEEIAHFLHRVHAGEEVAHLLVHAGHTVAELTDAMATLASGAGTERAIEIVSAALRAERSLGGKLMATAGRVAAPLVKALGSGKVGELLSSGGKLLSNPLVKGTLAGANVGLSIYNGHEHAASSTEAGKLAVGAAEGVASYAVMSNPLVALADVVMPDAVKPSKHLSGAINGVAAIAEGIVNWDERAMAKVHDRSLKGEYGWLMKQTSRLGDVIADQL